MSDSESDMFLNEPLEDITMPEFWDKANMSDNASFSSEAGKPCDYNDTLDLTNNLLKDISLCNTVKSRISVDEGLQEEIRIFKNLQKELADAKKNYKKSQLILKCAESEFYSDQSKLSPALREKCLKKFQFQNFAKTVRNNSQLPIENMQAELNLSDGEKKMVEASVKEAVTKEILQFQSEQDTLLDVLGRSSYNDLLLPGSALTEGKATILNLNEKLSNTIQVCDTELNKVMELIDCIYDIRKSKFQELYDREIECLENKIKLLALKMKNLNYIIEDAIVQEHENLEEAVNVLLKELNKTMDEACYSLERLRAKEADYKRLEGTQFNDILREFIGLRENYKNKCWALSQIQKI